MTGFIGLQNQNISKSGPKDVDFEVSPVLESSSIHLMLFEEFGVNTVFLCKTQLLNCCCTSILYPDSQTLSKILLLKINFLPIVMTSSMKLA